MADASQTTFFLLSPEQNGPHFANDILKCIFVNEKFVFWLNSHRSLVLRVHLTTSQCWFKQWLGAEQATGHYLDLCPSSSLTHICGTGGSWLKGHCLEWNVFCPKFVEVCTGGPIDNISTLVKVMAWCRTGAKPLPLPMLTTMCDAIPSQSHNELTLMTHPGVRWRICVFQVWRLWRVSGWDVMAGHPEMGMTIPHVMNAVLYTRDWNNRKLNINCMST